MALSAAAAEPTHVQMKVFFRACEGGDLKICKELAKLAYSTNTSREKSHILEYPSVDPEFFDITSDSYFTSRVPPLHVAAWNGHVDVVNFLLQDCGVNVNETVVDPDNQLKPKEYFYETALYRACERSHLEVCRTLLENGADHQLGMCAYKVILHQQGNLALLRLLLKHGANPENLCPLTYATNNPPLHIAIQHCCPETVQILFKNGCSMFHPGGLSISVIRMESEDAIVRSQMFRLLVQYAPANQLADCILYHVRHVANPEFVLKELLAAGADINCQSENGTTPIKMVLRLPPVSHLCIAHFLIQHNADPFLGDHFEYCFERVVEIGDKHLIEWILQCWSNKYGAANMDGNYPIHVACQNPTTLYKSIELLLEDAPDSVDIVNEQDGFYPVQLACIYQLDLSVVYTLLRQKPEMLSVTANSHENAETTMAADNPMEGEIQRSSKRQKLQML